MNCKCTRILNFTSTEFYFHASSVSIFFCVFPALIHVSTPEINFRASSTRITVTLSWVEACNHGAWPRSYSIPATCCVFHSDFIPLSGFYEFAERTELGKSSLYRMLDTDGNPRLSSIRAVLDSLGLKFG